MARWSSSASEPVDLNTVPLASGHQTPLAWAIRPGFFMGAPTVLRRSLIGLLLAVAGLVLAWLLAWVRDLGGMLGVVVGLIALLGAGLALRQLALRAPRAASSRQLCWRGPWPGQPAGRKARGRAEQDDVSRACFVIDGEPVHVRVMLWVGAGDVCVTWADRRWGWVSLTETDVDRALPVLLKTAQKAVLLRAQPPRRARAAHDSAGELASRMASSRTRQAVKVGRHADSHAPASARQVASKSEIHHKATGAPLESRRPHGPA